MYLLQLQVIHSKREAWKPASTPSDFNHRRSDDTKYEDEAIFDDYDADDYDVSRDDPGTQLLEPHTEQTRQPWAAGAG